MYFFSNWFIWFNNFDGFKYKVLSNASLHRIPTFHEIVEITNAFKIEVHRSRFAAWRIYFLNDLWRMPMDIGKTIIVWLKMGFFKKNIHSFQNHSNTFLSTLPSNLKNFFGSAWNLQSDPALTRFGPASNNNSNEFKLNTEFEN